MTGKHHDGSGWDARVRVRARFLGVIIPLLLCLPAARAFQLQILQREALSEKATRQSSIVERIQPRRGPIIDRNGQPLAISVPVPSIYAVRQEVSSKRAAAHKLAAATGAAEKDLYRRLDRGSGFAWLKRRVKPETAARVRSLALPGIYIGEESRRYYPNLAMAGAVLGFVGADGGLEGLENSLESDLRGGQSSRVLDRDARGKAIVSPDVSLTRAPAGATVQLTLDRNIQFFTEEALEKGCREALARDCLAIVMESESGRILAMANSPGFNPNDFERYGNESFRNRAVNLTYEPGSTFKVVTIAAALQEGTFDDKDILYCENGRFQVADRVVTDHVPHGWMTLRGIIKKSSNIGASKVGLEMGEKTLGAYVDAFGFGRPTGIEVPGEGRGIVRTPDRWTQVDLANISFGQGLAVTPVQMVAAVNAIAVDGRLMAPYLVERITTQTGEVIRQGEPRTVRRVVSSEVARKVKSMMESVVSEGGSGTRAAIRGYRVAGKTGTAQKFNRREKKYSEDSYVASFVGFAPADKPAVTVIVVVDEPREHIYGGQVAAPVWAEIVERSLNYLKIGADGPLPEPQPAPSVETRWADVRNMGDAQPAGMPDLHGLTLREALAALAVVNVKVDIVGKGVVIGQDPSPGRPMPGAVRLNLRPRAKTG